MKAILSLLLLLVSANNNLFTSAQSITPAQVNSWPLDPPAWTSNGYYFIIVDNDCYVYNISTGQTWTIIELVPQCTSNQFIVTSLNEYFCPSFSGATQIWYQFAPENFSVVGKFEFQNPEDFILSVQSDTYLSFYSGGHHTEEWSAVTYDTRAKQYICSVNCTGQNYQTEYDFGGSGYLYPGETFNGSVFYLPCNANFPVSTDLIDMSTVFANGFENFMNTTVFIGIGSDNSITFYTQAAIIDLTGKIRTGPKAPYHAVKLNDTHFASVYAQGGFWMIGLFTVGPSLNFIQTALMNTSLTSKFLTFIQGVFPVPGSNSDILVMLSDTSAYIYSFELQQITASFPDSAPFLLANGSCVNLTIFGYFIQSPGEPIYFIQAPYSTLYVDPSLNDVWTLYLPNQLNEDYGYTECLMTHFQRNTSKITQFTYSSCPKTLGFAQLGDVSLDNEGNPIATVFFSTIYVITSSGYSKVITINGDVYYQVSINTTSGVGVVAYNNGTDAFKIAKFYIANGTVFNTSTLMSYNSEYIGAYVQKLTERYFLLAGCNLNDSVFTVWDTLEQVLVSQVKFNMSFITLVKYAMQWRVYQYPVLGIVSEDSANPLAGIAWGYVNMIYTYTGQGSPVGFAIPGEEMYDLVQMDYGSYWAYSTGLYSNKWRNFDV